MNIKGLHPAFLRMLPNRGKRCFHLCKFFLGEINKVVKGQCLQSFFGQFFKGRILHTADDLAICKSFDAEIHKVDPCLYFVLVILCGGVGNTYIGKIGVVRTILTLILLTAKSSMRCFALSRAFSGRYGLSMISKPLGGGSSWVIKLCGWCCRPCPYTEQYSSGHRSSFPP